MLNPRTPGVFIQEISKLPPSVAPVATAIPAFIGYTEKRDELALESPVRITSLLDFEDNFGGPFEENYDVAVTSVTVNGVTTLEPSIAGYEQAPYVLYYAVQLYFSNGGGPCWIQSVGTYNLETPEVLAAKLSAGIDVYERIDEPTLLLVPEAYTLSSIEKLDINNKMLAQAAKLQDRFALIDVTDTRNALADAANFRSNEVGINNLIYGAAYYPNLSSSLSYSFNEGEVNVTGGGFSGESLATVKTGSVANSTPAFVSIAPLSTVGDLLKVTFNGVETIFEIVDNASPTDPNAIAIDINGSTELEAAISTINSNSNIGITVSEDTGTAGNLLISTTATGLDASSTVDLEINNSGTPLIFTEGSGGKAASAEINITSGHKSLDGKAISIITSNTTDFVTGTVGVSGSKLFKIGSSAKVTAENVVAAINGLNIPEITAVQDGTKIIIAATESGVAGNSIRLSFDGTTGARLSSTTLEGGAEGGDQPNVTLYNAIKALLNAERVELPPSAAVAGIYANVDRTRGVWKAPANVSVSGIIAPTDNITTEDQGELNVDPVAGKSINAIRPFTGKGNLVWGARTLAGNDNEWRYVPVRRLYIFIEESIKKATEAFVFEPNDAKTWLRIKGLAENFLTSLWREGALAGAAPADAFFVNVGLGETMSPQDILEGRLNVEIGLAAVRPAEFIILKFSHKLQES